MLRLAARSADAGGAVKRDARHPPAPDGIHSLATDRGNGRAHDAADGPTGPQAQTALRGGTWIGILERIAVTGCVLAGDMTSVALVVAVKGLGRYPELRENPGASERFVIGTLTSMIWAALVGVAGRPFLA